MSAKLEIPASELARLRRTLQEYAKLSRKTEAQICNDKARDWSIKAIQETEKANAEQIKQELGVIATKVGISKKTGKFRKGRMVLGGDTLASRIINARLAAKGEELIFGKALEDAARKMIAARVRAVAFIKSGWLAAANKIKGVAQKTMDGAGIRGTPKGTAIRAKESLRPVAEIINTATKDSPAAGAVANAGLLKALPRVIADTRIYIERKMQEATNKAGLGK